MMLRLCICWCLLSGYRLYAQEIAEEPEKLDVGGYVKVFQGASFIDDLDSIYGLSYLHHRINLRYQALENISLRLEMRTRVFYGEYVRNIPSFGSYIDRDDGFFDLSALWIDKKSLVAHSIIDRALVDMSFEDLRFTLGRQRINWGVTTLWNPNDIFNSYNFLDFDYEERSGTDAARATYHVSPFSSIDIGVSPSKRSDSTIAAARYTFNTSGFDIQLLGGIARGDYVGGIGFAGSISDVGVKGEGSYFAAKDDSAINTATFSLMGDYTFSDNWYIAAAYLYTSDPQGQLFLESTIGSSLSPKDLMPFRSTFYGGVSKAFTPITSASFGVVYSPTNSTLILFPRIDHSVAESFDLNLILQTIYSRISDRFRTQGSILYLGLRWSY